MNGVSVEEKTINDIFAGEKKYVVPLYQREYAWTECEVGRLLADIWEAYRNDSSRNYYVGTLVVKPCENEYEVIDGQQRLTTLSILYSLLKNGNESPVLRFANREEVDAALSMFYRAGGNDALLVDEDSLEDENLAEQNQRLEVIPNALLSARKCIKDFRPAEENGDYKNGLLFSDGAADAELCEYILNKVKVFQVCMQDVDAMSYFEVMNNRGEQLKYHELLKEKLVAGLMEFSEKEEVGGRKYDELAEIYDRIWTACSCMDGNLLDHLHVCFELLDGKTKRMTGHWWQLNRDERGMRDIEDEVSPPWERQSVIRDFSNFLMHILRLYVRNQGWDINVPLDERKMKDWFESPEIKINPVDFLDLLIKTRLDFDKYIIKAKMVNDEVDKWRLKEVVRYGNGRNKTYDAKNTYSEKLAQIVCLQSALQVSNADQRYKEWVYTILSASDDDRENSDRIIGILEDFARRKIIASRDNLRNENYDIYACGLRTPRLFLNIVDYLMWCEEPKDFVFKYYNSIEHHHPQHDDREQEQWKQKEIDEIGNLYLTSSSDNSSMGNTPASGKIALYGNNHGGNLPDYPKRKYMYAKTISDGWTRQKMQELTQDVKKLMDGFMERKS